MSNKGLNGDVYIYFMALVLRLLNTEKLYNTFVFKNQCRSGEDHRSHYLFRPDPTPLPWASLPIYHGVTTGESMMQTAMESYSREEYLTAEETAQVKHEFYQGEIFAMAGGTFNHGAIGLNITIALKIKLRGKSCQPTNSDVCIETPGGFMTYPDASVFCGPVELTDQQRTLLNPVVIIEVLSPSTRRYDRSDKFMLYRAISTFQDYLLIDSEMIYIEHFRKTDHNEWILHEYRHLAETIFLASIQETLTLNEIYEGMVFE